MVEKLVEFQLPLPFSVAEYELGQRYAIAQSIASVNDGQAGIGSVKDVRIQVITYADLNIENAIHSMALEGVSLQHAPIVSREIERMKLEKDVQIVYTKRLLHISSMLPLWVQSAISTLSSRSGRSSIPLTSVEETSWACYPQFIVTNYKVGGIEAWLTLTVVSTHTFPPPIASIDPLCQNLFQPNIFELNPSDIRSRVVDRIDIAVTTGPNEGSDMLPSHRRCVKGQPPRGPFSRQWLQRWHTQPHTHPLVLVYKLLRCKLCLPSYIPFTSSLSYRVLPLILSSFRNVYLMNNRRCFWTMDDWVILTLRDVKAIEMDFIKKMQQRTRDKDTPVTTHPRSSNIAKL